MPTKTPSWDKLNLIPAVKKIASRLKLKRGKKLIPQRSRAFQRHMAALGFLEFYHSGCGSDSQWRHESGEVIVKVSYFCKGPKPACAVPTIKLRGGGKHRLVAQPLCDTRDPDAACIALQDAGQFGFTDNHQGNVAFWNGKAVAIDW